MTKDEVLKLIAEALPAGTIVSSGAKNIPAGWEICDGREVSKDDPKYKNLYAHIGITWGGNANPNFKLPDLKNKFLCGANTSDDITHTGGSVEHSHSGTTGGCGNHSDDWHVDNRDGAPSAMGTGHQHDFGTNTINHLPPYTVIVYLIKL